MKILCVRHGNHYGPEYEEYLESKLPEYEFIWLRERYQDDVKLQWNKMYGMSLDIDEPIVVMDIDILLINDYKEIFEYPVERGEFLAMPGWWRDTDNQNYQINGGFFKYYPKDCRYIFDKFMENPVYWQKFYINNGTTIGPVNGEQFFVEDHVKERLNLKLLPNAWVTRWLTDYVYDKTTHLGWQYSITEKYKEASGNDYLFMGDFHPDIKMVHFTHNDNLPHLWTHYDRVK